MPDVEKALNKSSLESSSFGGMAQSLQNSSDLQDRIDDLVRTEKRMEGNDHLGRMMDK